MKVLIVFGAAMLTSVAAQAAPSEAPIATTAREAKNFDTLLKYYPPRALAAGEQGLVVFQIGIDKAGHPTACEVTHSSGHRRLDEETCQLMLIHGVFQPAKDAAGNRINQVSQGVVNWRIPGEQGQALATPRKLAATDAPEKMICKRTLRTGSMADFERTCMTKRDWSRMSDEMKKPWEEIKRNAKFE